MNKKKDPKGNNGGAASLARGEKGIDGDAADKFGEIANKSDLKAFLNSIRDKMTEQAAAPIYAVSALNYILNHPQVYDWLDNENKEIARDIWLRLRQAGLQLRNPPMLFGADEEDLVPPTV